MICDRREALRLFGGALGAAGCLGLPGCGANPRRATEAPVSSGPPPFPVIEIDAASGTHRDLGHAMGVQLRATVGELLRDLPDYQRVVALGRGPLSCRVSAFELAARARFAPLVEEVEGLAAGLEMPFHDLFSWICRSELKAVDPTNQPGCSTVGCARDGRMLLIHNEDGAAAYLGRMALLEVRPPSGVPFLSLVYPGTLPGNGPTVNARGLVQTTNYIATTEVPDGIPRYFIGRAICEARDLDEAVALATTEGRAFGWHHNLASLPEARLLSVETWPGRSSVLTVRGVHRHANHLIHTSMRHLPQDPSYLARSTRPRLAALERALPDPAHASREALLAALADREGDPCKVCRLPGDEVSGVTLVAALFEAPSRAMDLAPGCGRRFHRHRL